MSSCRFYNEAVGPVLDGRPDSARLEPSHYGIV